MENNKALYESLVSNNASDLYRIAYRLCGHRATAEDLVAETFLQAWRSLTALRDPRNARVWLIQILRHCWYHHMRTQSRRPRVEEGPQETAGSETAPQDQVVSDDWVRDALEQLSEEQREPFVLVVMEGFRCREVADMLELPLGTVLSRIHRARQVLREHLEREECRRAEMDGKIRRLHHKKP